MTSTRENSAKHRMIRNGLRGLVAVGAAAASNLAVLERPKCAAWKHGMEPPGAELDPPDTLVGTGFGTIEAEVKMTSTLAHALPNAKCLCPMTLIRLVSGFLLTELRTL